MAIWIYADERPQSTYFYYFKKKFNAKKGDKFDLSISADTRYQLYINSNLICEGPCLSEEHIRYYEKADASSALIDGENEILVKVMFVGANQFNIAYRKSNAALWFDGKLTSDGETTCIVSDSSWECLRDNSVKFEIYTGLHLSLPPFEHVLSEQILTPVPVRNWFDPLVNTNGFTEWGTCMPYSLHERPIPQMQEFPKETMTAVKRGAGYIIYDSGEYTTAKVYFKINAPKDTTIRITYAECCTFGATQGIKAGKKAIRDDINAEGANVIGAYDVIYAKGGEQTYSPFWFRAFRYIKIEFPEGVDCEIATPEFGRYFYPLDEAGRFDCSNKRFNRMWHISRNTLLCCTHETYVDCPYYEQGQYSMDGGLEMLYTFRTSSDKLMPLKFLTDLAGSQLPDGMIGAHYPSTGTQVIPDFTLFWILAVRDYLLYTGDKKGIAPFMGAVDKALEGFENLKTPEGLIGTTKYWPYVDWVPGWVRGIPPHGLTEPLTVTCLMYAAALRAAAEVYSAFGREARAAEYESRAKEMTETVKKYCYDEKMGLYLNSPSGDTYSQHTTVWAVLSGAVKGDEASALIDRTFSGDVDVAKCTFSMNYYLFRALESADRYCYAPKVFEGWETMLDLHCTSWCENPDNPRSECHAWSSAPTYEFSAMALGVAPIEYGFKTLRVKPLAKIFGLEFAKGTVPTPYGSVAVEWKIENGEFKLSLDLPSSEMRAEVVLPDGSVISDVTGSTSFECKI